MAVGSLQRADLTSPLAQEDDPSPSSEEGCSVQQRPACGEKPHQANGRSVPDPSASAPTLPQKPAPYAFSYSRIFAAREQEKAGDPGGCNAHPPGTGHGTR